MCGNTIAVVFNFYFNFILDQGDLIFLYLLKQLVRNPFELCFFFSATA